METSDRFVQQIRLPIAPEAHAHQRAAVANPL